MQYKLKDFVVPKDSSYHYFTISYDLRKDYMKTAVTPDIIRKILATLLVRHNCPEIRCFVATTVHFSSIQSPEFWYEEIKKCLGKFICFILEEIKINGNNEPSLSVHYSDNYISNYHPKLDEDYDTIVVDLRECSADELLKALAVFLMTN
jgi:hypothetical protein